MRIKDEQIIDAYNDLVLLKHPDPLGFIARADVLTGLNDSRTSKGFKGPFAVNIKKAKQLLYTTQEINDPSNSIEIQTLIDADGFSNASGDLEGMYRLSFAKGKNAFDKFFKQLGTKRKQFEKSFNLDDNGFLDSIGPTKAQNDSENSDTVVTTKDSRGPIEGTSVVTVDDFKSRPSSPVESVDILEQRLRVLIRILMREVTI